ncbi:hypothetical protein O181_081161 [Austropuccinia psidii MF-1]|uniref:Uncharacterized protein n=1 Tax=Austropuccinia psidii MF-1 TaxID=1389203 RepID=A0A9Q3FQ62_9BASI|nr:hypothetical protein [Austropuccinia psidii MF-1]
MSSLPDPPDPDDQMDIPEIFEGEPEMIQQGNSYRYLLHLLMQLVTRVYDQLDTMNQIQQSMEETTQNINKLLDNLENSIRTLSSEVRTLSKNPTSSKLPPPPSFVAIVAKSTIPKPFPLPNKFPLAPKMSKKKVVKK